MAEVKWIKITTDIFENRKIRQIEALPDGDAIVVIWLKILCLAGTINENGNLSFTPEIPYTDQMIATQFNRPLTTVQMAIKVFQQFGMIEIIDDLVHVSNWEKYQNVDGMDKIREQTRKRVAEYRERKKIECNVTSNATVTHGNGIEIDIDKEEDKDKEEIIIKESSSKISVKTSIEHVIAHWNSLSESVPKVSKISPGCKRYTHLKARLAEYGEEKVLDAIDQIEKSDFLTGKKTEFCITFDWFVRPNNFVKVLDGNYTNKQSMQQTDRHEQRFGFTPHAETDMSELEEKLLGY